MDTLARDLRNLGLTEKEAAVYVAALQLGPVSAHEIADRALVNRATTYLMIESLERRGLVSSIQKDKKRIYLAETPERLMALLQLQKKELEEQESEMVKLLPKLNALYNQFGEKPEVRYFEGLQGLEILRRRFEQLSGETVQIIGYDAFVRANEFEATREHRERLTHEDASVRALIISERTREDLQSQFWSGFDFRLVPPSAFPFAVEGEITVRADYLHMFTYASRPITIEIHSRVLADTMRAMFELAWKGVK